MTNDKATRQAIINGLKEKEVDYMESYLVSEGCHEAVAVADAILSRLSELQPEPSESLVDMPIAEMMQLEYEKIMAEYPDDNWLDFNIMLDGAGGLFIKRIFDKLPKPELQPEPKPINLGLRQTLIEILLDEGKDDFHSQRIARRIELALGELQPVNRTESDLVSKDEMFAFAAYIEGNCVGLNMDECYKQFKNR